MSTINWPASNLDDEQQPWRREVEKQLEDAARKAGLASTNTKAAQKGSAATRRAIARANLDIRDQQEQLEQAARIPAAPANPSATSDAYFDEYGYARGRATMTVSPVTSDSYGEPIALSRYELHARKNEAGQSWAPVAEAPATLEAPQLIALGLPAGENWAFKVRAISGSGVPGEFSAEIPLTLAKDTTPPAKPAPLTGTSRMSQVFLSWTGLTATGAAQPADFSHGEVGVAATAGGAGTIIGRIEKNGDTFVAPEQPYNVERFYYVIAVDFAGNRSTPSDRIPLTTKPLVATDVIGRVIDGANVVLGSIQENVIAAGAITEEKLSVDVTGKIDGAVADVAEAQAAADAAGSAAAAAGAAASAASTAAADALIKATTADTKADAADTKATAAGTAAATAQTKADTAKTTADAAQANADALKARGTDLITNGNATQGTKNFTGWTLEVGDQPPGTAGAFWPGFSVQSNRNLDEFISIDPAKPVLPSMWVRQVNTGVVSRCYFALVPHDVDGLQITPYNYMEQAGTRTTLASPLTAGDTTIQLTNATNWYRGGVTHQRSIIFWNWVDGKGKTWAPGTYSRNYRADAWAQNGITGNTITLSAPYAGPTVPAGTVVGNTQTGGNFMYAPGITNALVTNEWTQLTATAPFAGVHVDLTQPATLAYPVATVQVQVSILANYGVTGGTSKQHFAGLSLSEANAAQLRAAQAKAAADAAQATATAAQTAAGNAQTTANQAQASASGKSKTYRATTEPSGTGTAVEDTWEQWSTLAVGGKLLAFWRWSGSAWVKGTLDETYLPLVNIGAGTYGSLVGDRLTANTISTQKLLVTSLENLAQDFSFEYQSGSVTIDPAKAWQIPSPNVIDTVNPRTGSYALKVPSQAAAIAARQNAPVAVAAGEQYRLSAWVRLDSGTSANSGICLRMAYGATETTMSTASSDSATTPVGTGATYVKISGTWTAPEGAKFARLDVVVRDSVAGKFYRVDDIELYKMAAGELIVDGAISAGKIAADAVTAAKIQADAVTAVKIAADAVTAVKIQADAVTAVKIAAGAVTTVKLDALAVTAEKVAANAITTVKLDALAVTAAKIAVGAIEADKIAANAVIADKIAANAVTAAKIAALAVEADKIAANAVTADKINAGAVTTVKLDALAVTADKIAANAITATKISADAIDGKTITGALLRSSASGARTELTNLGLRTLNAANQELVRLGYGIATGMEVRNPATGTLVPLANAAFGMTSVAASDLLTFAAPTSPGGTQSAFTRHAGDTCTLTFVAVSSTYIIDFGQAWAINYIAGSFTTSTPYVGLRVNGVGTLVAGERQTFALPGGGLFGGESVGWRRVGSARGAVRLATTPGATYTLEMDFSTYTTGGSGTYGLNLCDRFIAATPVFS